MNDYEMYMNNATLCDIGTKLKVCGQFKYEFLRGISGFVDLWIKLEPLGKLVCSPVSHEGQMVFNTGN